MPAISRRRFLGTSVAALATAQLARAQENVAQRPNILFLLTDDQRWNALGCMGNAVVQTPNLDALARDGVLFTNAFVTTPICCVSRASILTGQYARRHGVQDFRRDIELESQDETYPALLRANGYCTGFMGKWGVAAAGDPIARAAQTFDFWAGDSGQSNYWHERNCPFVTSDGFSTKAANLCTCQPPGVAKRPGPEAMTDRVHQETDIIPAKMDAFLRGRDATKPFCMSISFKSCHEEWEWFSDATKDLYVDTNMPVPEDATQRAVDALPEFLKKSLGSERAAKFIAEPEQLQTILRQYYRQITGMDLAVGKIRALLESQGLASNTVIIFTSDNGYCFGDHGISGKWLGYDPSVRVPTMVFDPRLPQERRGTRVDEMVLNIDYAPTMLALAGISAPKRMQGVDIGPLVRGESVPWRDAWFFEHLYRHGGAIEPSEGVRTTRWKYLRYFNRSPVVEELYDLSVDPVEAKNLANDPAYVETLSEMRTRWQEYCNTLV